MIVDRSENAIDVGPELLGSWAASQRVFISSPMSDTGEHRRSVAKRIQSLGAEPVWFEEFGGRDDDPEQAYLSEVDSSTIYLAILNERYGRRLRDGFSATEAEYNRAIDRGKRVTLWVGADAGDRDGHLRRFIDDLRTFHVTGLFTDADNLAERVDRRLRRMAAEALAPWVKLDDFVFRARQMSHTGSTMVIRTTADRDLIRRLDPAGLSRRTRLASDIGVLEGELLGVDREIAGGKPPEAVIRLERVAQVSQSTMRASTSGLSAEDLVETGLRHLLFGEALPPQVSGLPFLADPGVDVSELREAFDLGEEVAEPIVSLVISDGMVGSGAASAITNLRLGPKTDDARTLLLEWEEPRRYTNVEPNRRRIQGSWRLANAPAWRRS